MASGNDTQMQLRWLSHQLVFTEMLDELFSEEKFADVTLCCNGGHVRAHKTILSLSSAYLGNILKTCVMPEISISLPEVPLEDIKCLISFIYKGQVDVPQLQIASFLNTGKHLQILGLEQGDQLVHSPKSEASSKETEDFMTGNNNVGERIKDSDDEDENVDMNIGEKVEVKLENVKTENDNPSTDNNIDLNFYLHQAVQSASMPCPVCRKEFKSQSGLRDHIRLHTGERPFACDYCQMNFARASHLKRHRRMHTGEKPFICELCGKEFSRGDKLKDHLRRHTADDKIQQLRKQITSDSPVDSVLTTQLIRPLSTVLPSGLPLTNSNNIPTSMQPFGFLPSFKSGASVESPKKVDKPLSSPPGRLIMPQTNITPSMVSNIGECILRPIN